MGLLFFLLIAVPLALLVSKGFPTKPLRSFNLLQGSSLYSPAEAVYPCAGPSFWGDLEKHQYRFKKILRNPNKTLRN